jgi:hypothetical protein
MLEEYDGAVTAPTCPTCGQPASQSLAGPDHEWECRNEACPEFGQAVGEEAPPPRPGEAAGPAGHGGRALDS